MTQNDHDPVIFSNYKPLFWNPHAQITQVEVLAKTSESFSVLSENDHDPVIVIDSNYFFRNQKVLIALGR